MLYKVLRIFAVLIFSVLFRPDVRGRENIPKTGPFILCANHRSWWDVVFLACITNRPVVFMGKAELFEIPLFGSLIRMLHAFPVKRNTADRAAIRKALSVLAEGGALGIFPEGTRSRDGSLLPPEPGVALLAIKSKAPVIPIGINGRYSPFGKLRLRVGKPLILEESREKKARSRQLEEAAAEVMKEIGTLLSD